MIPEVLGTAEAARTRCHPGVDGPSSKSSTARNGGTGRNCPRLNATEVEKTLAYTVLTVNMPLGKA